MSGYTKLFSSIVTSTVWCEDAYTRVVWVAMLAMKDRDGIVEGSIPGFARVANVTVEQMERAVQVLCGPDAHSRTPDHEGRRIELIPGGWRVLNHEVYRDLESPEHRREKDAERQRRHRARRGEDVTDCHASSPHTDADAKADTDTQKPKPPRVADPATLLIPEDLKAHEGAIRDWLAYKREKGQGYKGPKGLEALWRAVRAIPGGRVREAADHSMANNYTGLFAPKGNQNAKPKNSFRPSGGDDTREPTGGGGSVPAKRGGGGVVL